MTMNSEEMIAIGWHNLHVNWEPVFQPRSQHKTLPQINLVISVAWLRLLKKLSLMWLIMALL